MRITVLLADDHAVVRDGLRLLLEAQGDMSVIGAAADGEDAVRQARNLRPDVVVLDIAMPQLNGIEAAQQIHAGCPSTQIVILSMHATGEHIRRALQSGALGYLLKESAGAEVATAIREAHAGRRYLSRKIADLAVDSYVNGGLADDPLASLSFREHQVLLLVAAGKSSAEVGALLSLSPKTVETYRSRVMEKLGLKDLSALVRFAIRNGLTPLE